MPIRLKTSDPIWWGLFSAGGTVAAFLVPIHILVTGLGIGMGWIRPEILAYERVLVLVNSPLVQFYLFVFISLPMFHWAHRFRYVLMDLGMQNFRAPVAIFCYGFAIVGTGVTAWLLIFGF